MHDNKSLTKQGNTKSPGYVKCCEWLSEIWSHYDSEILKKSFVICGIQSSVKYRSKSTASSFDGLELITFCAKKNVRNEESCQCSNNRLY